MSTVRPHSPSIAKLLVGAALVLAACAGDDPDFTIGHAFPESAALETVEWYPESGKLRVWFAPGTDEAERSLGEPYLYCGVPRAVYDGLVVADAPGKYFHARIAERYDTGRLVSDVVETAAGPEPVEYWTCER